MTLLLILFIAFQLKHWLCDYPLQRPWMLGKFKPWPQWVAPLAAHAAVHGAFTFLLTFGATLIIVHATLLKLGYGLGALTAQGWWELAAQCVAYGLIDFGAHFAMDRIKASPRLLGRWKPLSAGDFKIMTETLKDPSYSLYSQAECKRGLRSNRLFWHVLGLDQMVHHLTHYYILFAMFTWWLVLVGG